MGKILVHNEPGAGYWIAGKCGAPYNPAMDNNIAIKRDGEVIGGCLFTQWTGRGGSCTIHVGSDQTGRWATPRFLQSVFHHTFVWWDCEKIFAQVSTALPDNVMQFNLNLGFNVEHLVKDVYPDGDMILLAMYKRDCKFLVKRPGGHLFG
jgi:hypothetical protein